MKNTTIYYAMKVFQNGELNLSLPVDGCRVSTTIADAVQELFKREGLSLLEGLEFQTVSKRKKTMMHYPAHEDDPLLPWCISVVSMTFPDEILSRVMEKDSYDKKSKSMWMVLSGIDYMSLLAETGKPIMHLYSIDLKEMDLEILEESNCAILHSFQGTIRYQEKAYSLSEVAENEGISTSDGHIGISVF